MLISSSTWRHLGFNIRPWFRHYFSDRRNAQYQVIFRSVLEISLVFVAKHLSWLSVTRYYCSRTVIYWFKWLKWSKIVEILYQLPYQLQSPKSSDLRTAKNIRSVLSIKILSRIDKINPTCGISNWECEEWALELYL